MERATGKVLNLRDKCPLSGGCRGGSRVASMIEVARVTVIAVFLMKA